VRNVENGTEPADAHVREGLAVLAADVRNGIRQVDDALTELAIARVSDVRLERRGNGREYGSMQPRADMTLPVERGFQMLRIDRMVIIVVDIILPLPRYLDRRANRLR